MAYQDGNFTNAIQDGPARVFYPFINAPTKDTTTKGTVRNYVVVPSSYTPAAALSTDPADNTQYLIEETDLTVEGGLGRYARTYCKVPGQQIEPGTIVLSKPTIPGNDAFPRNFGSYLVVQPDTTLEQYDSYKRATVTSDSGVPGFYPTGGTYTLSFSGNTTSAINYAANAATVQTALNGFSTIQNRGNVTVSGSYNSSGGFDVTFGSISAATLNVSPITVTTDSTLASSVTSSQSGYAQAFQITTTANNFTNTSPSINVSAITYTGSPGFLTGRFEAYQAPSRKFYGEIQATGNLPQITGGTFTLSLFGQTTAAISYSANDSTLSSNISTALNNLSSVTDRGGTTVTLTRSNPTSGSFYFYADFTGSKITGGTFSINIFSQNTSALNYNSSPSDIETALNNLSNVQSRGNVVVTSSSGTSTILASGNALAVFSIGFSNDAFGGNAVSLSPSGSAVNISKTDGTIGRTQRIAFASSSATRTLYAAGHEIDSGETIYIRNSGSVFANIAPSKVTVIDANTIQLSVLASDTWASVASITEMGPRTKVNYEPGSVVIRSKTTTDFYLPGVTSGITTADDIPIPVDESGTAAFLQGVFSGQDNINVRVGELRPWRGPILLVDRTSIASADV
jgi:hypothetical protein